MLRSRDCCLMLCLITSIVISRSLSSAISDDENEDPYTTTDPKKREPSPCEICKYFVTELKSRLAESAKSKEVIETGHGLDKKKSFQYLTSELRLTEAIHEPHICENILHYNVHAERKGSLRYAKGMSETMQTLHGLVNKGVQVELGIPYELWDRPSAEVSKMHRACFVFAERYEEDIENWYYNLQDQQDLMNYLCADRYLSDKDQNYLSIPCAECHRNRTLVQAQAVVKGKMECLSEDYQKSKKRKAKKSRQKGDSEEAETTTTRSSESVDESSSGSGEHRAEDEL